MTQHESAIELLAERLVGTDASLSTLISEILATALQDLIEAELSAKVVAEPGERTAARTAQRNCHRDKLVSTPAGDVTVGIPKLQTGSFFPSTARTTAPGRQCAVGGDHDRLQHRHPDHD